MNYLDIKEYDIANGPGVRISLFVSGCNHHCKGCFNEVSWDFNSGQPFTDETIEHILKLLENEYIEGLSLLGGEPLDPLNQESILKLVKAVRKKYKKKKTIWCYTGYLFDLDIKEKMFDTLPYTKELISLIDVIVDGKFKIEEKDLTIIFRGSRNQRIIDVQKSLKNDKIILDKNDSIRLGGSKK